MRCVLFVADAVAVLDFAVVMLVVSADRQMTLMTQVQLIVVFTVLTAVIVLEIPVVKPFNCCQMTQLTLVILILVTSLRTQEIPAYPL